MQKTLVRIINRQLAIAAWLPNHPPPFTLYPMQLDGHDIGVCSWSVHAGDPAALIALLKQLGLRHVHLALGPLLAMDDGRRDRQLLQLADAGVVFTAGMIGFAGEDYSTLPRIRQTGGFVPDELWIARRETTLQAGRLARRLGIGLLTSHIGTIPPSNHPNYPKLLNRVGEVAAALAVEGIAFAAETGPETAAELLQFINDLPRPAVGVNFDPANFIMYGKGEPTASAKLLGRHIRHVHIKDAVAAAVPGEQWGKEVPPGQGDVDWPELLLALKEGGYTGPLVFERETGDQPGCDLELAMATLRAAVGE